MTCFSYKKVLLPILTVLPATTVKDKTEQIFVGKGGLPYALNGKHTF
jgi:hypothetical protein